jgi:hypothetical protein
MKDVLFSTTSKGNRSAHIHLQLGAKALSLEIWMEGMRS